MKQFRGCGKVWFVSSVSETGERALPRTDVDPDRFRAMYVQHADVLFGYFARRVGSDLAEDLLAVAR